MADGTPLIGRILTLLNADTSLRTLIGRTTTFAKPSRFSPVDNLYPQITVWVDEGDSEPVFPAGKYAMEIIIWLDKKAETEPLKKLGDIGERIKAMFNRKASSISDINLGTNTGLRISFCLKTGGGADIDEKSGCYFKEIDFELTVSENEDFTGTGGNATWV